MSLPTSTLDPNLEDPFDPKKNYYAASNPCGMVFRVKEDFWHGKAPAGYGSRLDITKGERGMCILHVNMPNAEWMQVKVSRDNGPTFGWVPRVCLDIFRKPQGYPCRAKRDVAANPTAQKVRPKDSAPVISVRKGTEGTLQNHLDFKDDQGRAMTYCLVATFRPSGHGWIPLNDLEIGPRPVRMEVTENRVSRLVDQPPTKQGEGSLLFNTVVVMLKKWRYENAYYGLSFLHQTLEKRIPDSSGLETIALMICDGVKKAGLDRVFESKNFTLQDMEKHSKFKTTEELRKLSGVYCIRYRFSGNQSDKFYIGSSINMDQRSGEHGRLTVANSASFHYQAASKATSKQLFAICLPQMSNFGQWRNIIEQFFISALDAYVPQLLDPEYRLDSDYEADRKYAIALCKVARDVSAETGWAWPRLRPGSAPFKAQNGLNFKSPIVAWEYFERNIWTRIDLPSGIARFQRPSKTVFKIFSPFHIGLWTTKNTGQLHLSVPVSEIDDLEEGDEAYPVVEIRLDNQPHRMPWAHLPEVGHFTDWHLANTVGIYFDWKGRKGWHRYWMLSSRKSAFLSETMGELSQYVNMIALRNFLLQQRQVQPRGGQLDLGPARVIQIEHDHFLQTNRIFNRFSTPDDVYVQPERRSIRAVGDEIRQFGVGRVGGPPGVRTPKAVPRKSCDACYIAKYTHMGALDHFSSHREADNVSVVCKRENDDDETCRLCYFMGRPCTWTDTAVLRNNTRLFRALTFIPVPDPQLENIADPGYAKGDTSSSDVFIPVRKT